MAGNKAIVIDVKCHHNPDFNMDNIHNMVVSGVSYWVTLCEKCQSKLPKQKQVKNDRFYRGSGQEIEGATRPHTDVDSTVPFDPNLFIRTIR